MGLKLTFYKKFYIFNLYIAYIFAIPVSGRIKDRAGRIYTDRIKEKEGRNVSTGESICGKIPYVTGE